MLRAVRKFFAFSKTQNVADEIHRRHLAWDRACRARGMTAREQADELQIRCAWVRLRRKASGKVLKSPRRFRAILDRVAMDEAKTLRAIGGEPLADAFLRAYEAAEPLEVLSREAALAVRAEASKLVAINDAPDVAPELPAGEATHRARHTGAGRKPRPAEKCAT